MIDTANAKYLRMSIHNTFSVLDGKTRKDKTMFALVLELMGLLVPLL